MVMVVVRVTLPYIIGSALPCVQLNATVRPLKFSVPMFQAASIVTVLPVRKPLPVVAPESSMMQVS